MARIQKFSPKENLRFFETFINDDEDNSKYFRVTEFKDTFTGGKNGFLIEGTPYLKESTEIKIEILDVDGNPVYFEPGDGIPEYYEGTSKVIAVYVYETTPIGEANITILGELKEYVDDSGLTRDVPEQWKGIYNVKWERTLNINKNLPNEDKVRFYRRPKVEITEILKPIFIGTANTIIKSGSLTGIPLVPNTGDELTGFSLPTSYRLKITDTQAWTGSIIGETIQFDDINYSPTVDDIVSKDEAIVTPPYAPNGIVQGFTDEPYTASFDYIEGTNQTSSSLIGSFARIKITDLKTFVGDVSRVKVFRRSLSQIADYEFIQEIQLESNELLRDIETGAATQVNYGLFTQPILNDYWVQDGLTATFDVTTLYNSVKLDGTENQYFYTSQSIQIDEGVEYTLDFNVTKPTVADDESLRVFVSGSFEGSPYEQNIVTIDSSTDILQKTSVSENIIADNITSASLYFEVIGTDWYINSVSFKASQETSFSPDEITFIQQVPKIIQDETFDYRFDFYDINSNFIPVGVNKTKTFTGGNVNSTATQNLDVSINPPYFTFDSGSNPVAPTIVDITIKSNVLTGSYSYTSGAYDPQGNLISPASYTGGEQYPGLLSDITTSTPYLTVGNFTGSLSSANVQTISYELTQGSVSESFTISRVQDGVAAISVENKNPTFTFPAQPDGTVTSYDGSGTVLKVYEGETKLLYEDEWNINFDATTGSINPGADFLNDGNAIIIDHSAMTTDTATITYSITGSRINGNTFYAETLQTFTKAKEGVSGSTGPSGSAGPTGSAGPGIVYRGYYDVKNDYIANDQRSPIARSNTDDLYYIANSVQIYEGEYAIGTTYDQGDIVFYTPTSQYWYSNTDGNTGNDPTSGLPWVSLGPSPDPSSGTLSSLWDSFGSTFESVATDILFAQDVYSDRTVNIGSDGANPVIALNADASNSNANPYISIGQDSNGSGSFNQEGIYIGYNNQNPVLSIVSGSFANGSHLSFNPFSGVFDLQNIELEITGPDGTTEIVGGKLTTVDALLRGELNTEAGNIGAFTINGDELRSSNSRLILDATNERIRVSDLNNSLKFEANTATELPSVTATDSGSANPSETASGTATTNNNGGASTNLTVVTSSIATFNPTETTDYTFNTSYDSTSNASLDVEAWGSEASAQVSIQYIVRTGSVIVGQSEKHSVSVIGSYQFATPIDPLDPEYEATQQTNTLGDRLFTWDASLDSGSEYTVYANLSASVNVQADTRNYATTSPDRMATGSIDYNHIGQPAVSWTALPTKTTINGGGMISIVNPNEFFRVGSTSTYNTAVEIQGGLEVDSIIMSPSGSTFNTPSTGDTYGITALPNGFIMQFGFTNTTQDESVDITFPTTFPNNIFSVSAHGRRTTSGASGYNHITSFSTSGFTAVIDVADGTSQRDVHWIAIGN